MTSGRIGCAIAVAALLCVLTIFFFPAVQGPYSAVHGPVTALLALRAAASVRTAIMSAGSSVVRTCLAGLRIGTAPLFVLFSIEAFANEFLPQQLRDGFNVILRC